MREKPAILIFSRTPQQEAWHKQLTPRKSKKANLQIASHLIAHTREVARQTGLPVFYSSSEAQIGNTFGERFVHAVEQVFARGYEKVITIGNDCPALSPEALLHAAGQLQSHDAVLGPAADGGAYLIGFSQKAFSKQSLLPLPWQQPLLLEALMDYMAASRFSCAKLAVLSDVDRASDLWAASRGEPFRSGVLHQYAFSSANRLLLLIKHLLASFQTRYFVDNTVFIPTFARAALAVRGPPFSL